VGRKATRDTATRNRMTASHMAASHQKYPRCPYLEQVENAKDPPPRAAE
jgi:hypothetical protein